mmetsp:Transcript_7814/g.29273  ORF Transcript_7814/g.29273 Transcript_7814/m.29273 type:complete len:382 (+) Transcript_7814:5928-7073(+)
MRFALLSASATFGYTTWSRNEPCSKYGLCGSHINGFWVLPETGVGVRTVPSRGSHSPARTRSSEVLPDPFGPVISKLFPGLTAMVTFLIKSRCPPPGSGAPTDTLWKEMLSLPLLCSVDEPPFKSPSLKAPPPFSLSALNRASFSFVAKSVFAFSSFTPKSMVRNNCPRRCVYPASSSRFRPSNKTSVNALPHRSISSSVALKTEMRSPSEFAALTMNGTCTKMDPTRSPWNFEMLSAADLRMRCSACHRCVTTRFFNPSSRIPISRSAPPSNATSSACAMSRACVCRNPPSRACSLAIIFPNDGAICRSTAVMKICAPKSANGREYPSSFAASVKLNVNSRIGLNECPYRNAASFENASMSATIRWSTLSRPPERKTAVR